MITHCPYCAEKLEIKTNSGINYIIHAGNMHSLSAMVSGNCGNLGIVFLHFGLLQFTLNTNYIDDGWYIYDRRSVSTFKSPMNISISKLQSKNQFDKIIRPYQLLG